MMKELDIKKLLGKRIKEIRIKRGLTQERLAELIEIGERNLSKIECGLCFVKAETIARLLQALEVESKELFDFSEFQESRKIKKVLIDEIKNDKIDVDLLYKIYRAIKY